MEKVKVYFTRRFGAMELQGTSFTHASVEISQQGDFPVDIARKVFTHELQLLPASADLWKQRQRALNPSDIRACERISDMRTVSRPDICARSAASAARVTHLQAREVNRINDLVRAEQRWQGKAISTPKSDLGRRMVG